MPKTTSPRSDSTVPDDHTLPQLSSSTWCDPAVGTSVWNFHTGAPVWRLAATM